MREFSTWVNYSSVNMKANQNMHLLQTSKTNADRPNHGTLMFISGYFFTFSWIPNSVCSLFFVLWFVFMHSLDYQTVFVSSVQFIPKRRTGRHACARASSALSPWPSSSASCSSRPIRCCATAWSSDTTVSGAEPACACLSMKSFSETIEQKPTTLEYWNQTPHCWKEELFIRFSFFILPFHKDHLTREVTAEL